jgi:hypothetical protein
LGDWAFLLLGWLYCYRCLVDDSTLPSWLKLCFCRNLMRSPLLVDDKRFSLCFQK